LVRVSVGIKSADDIIADLDRRCGADRSARGGHNGLTEPDSPVIFRTPSLFSRLAMGWVLAPASAFLFATFYLRYWNTGGP
jgi:hypothetical protein